MRVEEDIRGGEMRFDQAAASEIIITQLSIKGYYENRVAELGLSPDLIPGLAGIDLSLDTNNHQNNPKAVEERAARIRAVIENDLREKPDKVYGRSRTSMTVDILSFTEEAIASMIETFRDQYFDDPRDLRDYWLRDVFEQVMLREEPFEIPEITLKRLQKVSQTS